VVVADTESLAALAAVDLAEFALAADLDHSMRVLIVVEKDDPSFCGKLLRMGFAGAIERSASPAVFQRALDAVAEGELWASRKTISALVRGFLSDASPRRLTAREEEVLSLLAKGYKNQEIADALFVTHETIRWHLRGIYGKLGVNDRKGAREYALTRGMSVERKPSTGANGPDDRPHGLRVVSRG
jgi:DNA-binding NarL/FixJ family response regulator